MKSKIFTRVQPVFIFLLLLTAFSFERCSDKCQVKSKFTYYEPVYSTTDQIKAETGMKAAREISILGKIYIKGTTLFVNEVGEGIHIFDNHDPSHPQSIGFLNVPGNRDLAVQGNTLYADSYVDLVAFDVTDIHAIHEVSRIEGLFMYQSSYGFVADPVKGVITRWEKRDEVTVMQSECEAQIQPWGGMYYDGGVAMLYSSASSAKQSLSAVAPSGSPGIGGSTARFAIINQFLYGLDGTKLNVVDIHSEAKPVAANSITVAWDAETLFPHNDNLFIGARAGMYIFDLTTPDTPALIGQYDHIMSCDPVVVEGDYAYVTLYSGGLCHVETNQLEVVDIKDLTHPKLVSVFPMTNPHGLGIDDGVLFICDGDAGLKVFDASDPLAISEHSLAHYDNIHALDIIPFNKIAILIGSDGIFQYDYSDVKNITLLSQIPVAKQ